jgi:exonuclease SbcC
VEEGGAEPLEVAGLVEREIVGVREYLDRKRDDVGLLEQGIGQEKERLRKQELLERELTGHREQIAKRQRRIDLRKIAGGLLEGAMRQISRRFNRNLRDLVGRTLPLLTDGRYEHLQIDDDLSVRVFSSEKRDFMDLEEISSGTQRQVMLAVRLALSQELVDRAVHGSQFLILDEPFAFFDQDRTLSALDVLPKFSKEIKQIWIISQEFPSDSRVAMHLECTRGSKALGGATIASG